MPDALPVHPSDEDYSLRRRIYDTDVTQTITIQNIEVSEVNGSPPPSQPDWFTSTINPQRVKDGRTFVPLDFAFSIPGLRNNGVSSFSVQVDATDGEVDTTHDYTFIVDDLTESGSYRLTFVDLDPAIILSQDLPDGTDLYHLADFPYQNLNPNRNGEDTMQSPIQKDADLGLMFYKTLNGTAGFSTPATTAIRRHEIGDSPVQLVEGEEILGFDIDRPNQEIYYAFSGQGFGNGDEGINKVSYDGTNVTPVSNNFGRARDIAIDPATNTMFIVGRRLLLDEYSLLKTSLSNPDADVEAAIKTEDINSAENVAVDWENGRVFTMEGDGAIIRERDLSLSSVQSHGSSAGDKNFGIAVSPDNSRVYWGANGDIISAPYSDLSNQTVERTGLAVFPNIARTATRNAPPLWELRENVEYRESYWYASGYMVYNRADVSTNVSAFAGATLVDGQSRLYVCDDADDEIHQYDLSTAGDLSTLSFARSFSPGFSPISVLFNADGSALWTFDKGAGNFVEFGLSTPYDISSATQNQTFTLTNQPSNPHASFGPNYDRLFLAGDGSGEVRRYDLSTSRDPKTGSDVSASTFSGTSARGLFFGDDGAVLGLSSNESKVLRRLKDTGLPGFDPGQRLPSVVDAGSKDGLLLVGFDTSTTEIVELRTL